MDRNINVRQALRVFQKVLDLGTPNGETTTYKQLDATSGYDGYTIVLSDECVNLTIFFHNKFALKYTSKRALYAFLGKLEDIDRVRAVREDRGE